MIRLEVEYDPDFDVLGNQRPRWKADASASLHTRNREFKHYRTYGFSENPFEAAELALRLLEKEFVK